MRAQRVGAGRAEITPAKSSATMRSPVYWALLGLVIERSGYGYDLLKRFEREYGDLLPISSESHIYTALNVLERGGLVEQVPPEGIQEARTGRQPRPRYRSTPAGVDGYRRWLMGQVRNDRLQASLFMRQLAVFAREPEVALEIIERYRQACLEEAQNASIVDANGSHAADPAGLAARLAAEESRLAMESRLPWVAFARRQFEALGEAKIPSDDSA
jgi:DNA-binding PadR family transcriptional regulator